MLCCVVFCARLIVWSGLVAQIAHMTKSEMDYWDWGLLGPSFLFLNQYFNCFVPEHWVLWLATVWGTIDLMRYCSQVGNDGVQSPPPFCRFSPHRLCLYIAGLLGDLRPPAHPAVPHSIPAAGRHRIANGRQLTRAERQRFDGGRLGVCGVCGSGCGGETSVTVHQAHPLDPPTTNERRDADRADSL